MADRIKGITVEIGGDTIGLSNALKDVNSTIKTTQTELKDVERLLKFDPNNVELLAQRQQLLTQNVAATTDKLNQLRAAEQQVQAQFERGDIGEEQYRAFRRELQQTEQQLQGYQQSLVDMDREQERVGQGTRQLGAFFDATGTSVQDYANVIGNRLVTAINNGTATSRDLEYAFQRIGRQAIGAQGDIERLRTTLASVDSGNSIQNIRRDLQQLQQESEQTAESVEGIGIELENVAGALVAGGGIAGAIEQALDISSLNTKIDISMEVSKESKASVIEAVRQVEAYGVDAEAALEGVRRQWTLNKDATDEQNATLVKMAGTVAASFAGVDFNELIQETNEIASALKISNEDAIALTNSLLKAGFPPEQLDTISEYGTQMQLAGFSAKEVQAIFAAGIDTKTWNIDNLNDGVKEARLTMAGFGSAMNDELKGMVEQTGISSKQFQQWGKDVAEGGDKGSKAMGEVSTWLEGIDSKTLQNDLATKVFGTKWEDQGPNMIAVYKDVATAVDHTSDNMAGMQEQMDTLNADPAVKMNKAFSDLKRALQPVLMVIADLIAKVAQWVSENPTLTATIVAITTAVGILVGGLMALAPIIFTLQAAAAGLGIGLLPLVGIIAGVVAAIGLLVAAGIAIYKNWDEIAAFATEIWGKITEFLSNTWQSITEMATSVWGGMTEWFTSLWTSIKDLAVSVWGSITEFFSSTWTAITEGASAAWEGLLSIASTVWTAIVSTVTAIISPFVQGVQDFFNSMKDGVSSIFEGLIQYFTNAWELIKNIFIGALLLLVDLITLDFEGMKSHATQIFQNMSDALSGMWEGLKKIFSGALDAIKGFVSTAWDHLKNNTTTVFNAVKDFLVNTWNSIKLSLQTIGNNIKNAVSNSFEALKTAVSDKMKAAEDKIAEIWNGIKTNSAEAPEQIKNTVRDKFQALKDAVQEKMKAAKDKIEEIWNQAKSFLTNIDLKKIGKNIIQGLINGIGDMAKKVYDKLSGIAKKVKETFTGILGIHSPSRVFAGYGVNINEGLIKGIQSSSSQLDRAVNNVYGNLADSAGKMLNNNDSNSTFTNRNVTQSQKQEHEMGVKQPVIIQLTLDGQVLAQQLFSDINDMLMLKYQQSATVRGYGF